MISSSSTALAGPCRRVAVAPLLEDVAHVNVDALRCSRLELEAAAAGVRSVRRRDPWKACMPCTRHPGPGNRPPKSATWYKCQASILAALGRERWRRQQGVTTRIGCQPGGVGEAFVRAEARKGAGRLLAAATKVMRPPFPQHRFLFGLRQCMV